MHRRRYFLLLLSCCPVAAMAQGYPAKQDKLARIFRTAGIKAED